MSLPTRCAKAGCSRPALSNGICVRHQPDALITNARPSARLVGLTRMCNRSGCAHDALGADHLYCYQHQNLITPSARTTMEDESATIMPPRDHRPWKQQDEPIEAVAPPVKPPLPEFSGGVSTGPRKMPAAGAEFEQAVDDVLKDIGDFLKEKNRRYGNSALAPLQCFCPAPPIVQIQARIDDKINRRLQGEDAGEDVEWDLLGYFVLLRIAKRCQHPGG